MYCIFSQLYVLSILNDYVLVGTVALLSTYWNVLINGNDHLGGGALCLISMRASSTSVIFDLSTVFPFREGLLRPLRSPFFCHSLSKLAQASFSSFG